MPSRSDFFRFLESEERLSVSKLSLESRLFDRERERERFFDVFVFRGKIAMGWADIYIRRVRGVVLGA
jgi:hypothetical protein